MYKLIIRPLLFLVPPEKIHHIVFAFLHICGKIPGFKTLLRWCYDYQSPQLERELFGVKFKNPVGLAAGFDKDARLVDVMECLGFGSIEIGTVTPLPQPGNPQPRLFRLPKDKALINRMGFNNEGVYACAERLRLRESSVIVGGNIGKNKNTANEKAISDYALAYDGLYHYVDYFVVNVSSPNTPGLRELQDKEPLTRLLTHIKTLSLTKSVKRPVLLKIAPDLSDEQLADIVEILKTTGVDGVIATNTTISRDGLQTDDATIKAIGNGGLSGAPVKKRSTEVIRYLRTALGPGYPIIGVGGIATAEDALEKFDAGADLVQVYTGFIYEGPALAKKINKALVKRR